MIFRKHISILLFVTPITIFAQLDTLSKEYSDPSKNRLFFMSTGYSQSPNVVSFQIHELVGYQIIYSPFKSFQLNAGWGVPNQFVGGAKLEVYSSDHFLRTVAINFDAIFRIQNKKFENKYILPNIITTMGFDQIQLSLCLTPAKVEKFMKIPVVYSYTNLEDDGYRGEKKFYLFPAYIQTGLMFNSVLHRFKFIVESLHAYEGKADRQSIVYISFGFRKYWSSSYFDIAFLNYTKRLNPGYSESYIFPYFSYSFTL